MQGQNLSNRRKLLYREIYGNVGPASTTALYGSKEWVDKLDITNELYGHTGCVNALSWSRSGQLLASGSDDTHINIHTTTPTFSFNTSIETGHSANIFSVKFMPYSDDRKLVSCAGDWEVRVFDVEYAPTSTSLNPPGPAPPPAARHRAGRSRYSSSRANIPRPAKLYTPSEASAKVYSSHADRVKRIVTENSPYLFLTCSEDGEVRQFDLRQPSSYYQRGSGSGETRSRAGLPRRFFGGISILSGPAEDSDDRNPPLISYKRHRIELNTISCSVGQPHYIALGGAHINCFLHDRRMIGRDRSHEAGQPSSYREEDLTSATRCVRRFAPPRPPSTSASGVRRAREARHITACKISDARPDDIIVSWSGDNIYLFDINRSPEGPGLSEGSGIRKGKEEGKARVDKDRKGKSREEESEDGEAAETGKASEEGSKSLEGSVRTGIARKRKRGESRAAGGSSSSAEVRPKQKSAASWLKSHTREGTPVGEESHEKEATTSPTSQITESLEVPGHSLRRIAGLIADLRSELFVLASAKAAEAHGDITPKAMVRSWTAALGLAKVCIQRMDEIIKELDGNAEVEPLSAGGWNRINGRRFVQVAGALAFALGGRLQALSPASLELTRRFFGQVEGTPGSKGHESRSIRAQFDELGWRYSFLQLITEYIKGGPGGVGYLALEKGFGFVGEGPEGHSEAQLRAQTRLLDAMSELSTTVKDHGPLMDIDHPAKVLVSGGEIEAWSMFREAVEKNEAHEAGTAEAEARNLFWGVKVARALLQREGAAIDFTFIYRAFDQPERGISLHGELSSADVGPSGGQDHGGSRTLPQATVVEEELDEEMVHLDEYLQSMQKAQIEKEENRVRGGGGHEKRPLAAHAAGSSHEGNETENKIEEDQEDDDDESEDEGGGNYMEDGDYSDDDDDDDDDDGGYDDYSEEGEEEHEGDSTTTGHPRHRPDTVEAHAPISNSIRAYTGHCNVRTVKDVNFYGLNDEYVVSGSDCGHVFIWDKQNSKLVQLLHGDAETVNVITGHPFEPQLAVSGIDDTIKIFSPDQAAQAEFLGKERVYMPRNDEEEMKSLRSEEGDNVGREKSRRRLHEEYRIMSQNYAMRDNGVQEALVTCSPM